jgi:hypothetical protein
VILWKFKEHPETRSEEPGNTIDWPCKAFRWAIEASASLSRARNFFHIGLVRQHQWKSTNEWQTGHVGNWEIHINDHWAWGEEHVYYDGPHCFFDLGFIHISYPAKGGWCKKCMPDD